MQSTTERQAIPSIRPEVRCPQCNQVLFDGIVVKSRVLRVLPRGAEAKCRCKTWVRVPLTYSDNGR
ncbi:hypothetical protein FAZ79_00530 [Guyparkeria sp. SB14A]|uniref:hypothetical protein n=1 Tax=Guyparkeria sp. SB14A TaxID=2571147 RepID=UPI0010AB8BD2|nr:hypothetical protein [Guyparkeria sp. SB14A]TKA91825.1 hypothetical protein FAZ79_00530 [Guyparkeria sp. SB14A]